MPQPLGGGCTGPHPPPPLSNPPSSLGPPFCGWATVLSPTGTPQALGSTELEPCSGALGGWLPAALRRVPILHCRNHPACPAPSLTTLSPRGTGVSASTVSGAAAAHLPPPSPWCLPGLCLVHQARSRNRKVGPGSLHSWLHDPERSGNETAGGGRAHGQTRRQAEAERGGRVKTPGDREGRVGGGARQDHLGRWASVMADPGVRSHVVRAPPE